MILKLGQELEWDHYVRKDKTIKALKMTEDFLIETHLHEGFLRGKRGDYIVEVAPGIRFPCAESQFLESYVPVQSYLGERRRGERRCGLDADASIASPNPPAPFNA